MLATQINHSQLTIPRLRTLTARSLNSPTGEIIKIRWLRKAPQDGVTCPLLNQTFSYGAQHRGNVIRRRLGDEVIFVIRKDVEVPSSQEEPGYFEDRDEKDKPAGSVELRTWHLR